MFTTGQIDEVSGIVAECAASVGIDFDTAMTLCEQVAARLDRMESA